MAEGFITRRGGQSTKVELYQATFDGSSTQSYDGYNYKEFDVINFHDECKLLPVKYIIVTYSDEAMELQYTYTWEISEWYESASYSGYYYPRFAIVDELSHTEEDIHGSGDIPPIRLSASFVNMNEGYGDGNGLKLYFSPDLSNLSGEEMPISFNVVIVY